MNSAIGAILASMEPCLFRHGKGEKTFRVDGRQFASMEPCLFRHGKRRPATRSPSAPALQWSHVFSDMVRVISATITAYARAASMEPCLFRHGKRLTFRNFRKHYKGFNGAMSFQTW
mgnify:CR=1 FL=1